MSQYIVNEASFFLHSLLLGMVITFVYDGFLILRRLIKHSILWISLEDTIFWMVCAVGVFYMLYEENNGILRWFAVFAATLGMMIYKISVSHFFVDVMSTIIAKIFHILFCIFRFFMKPIGIAGNKTMSVCKISLRKTNKIGKYMKIRLTRQIKLLKITLCKQHAKD